MENDLRVGVIQSNYCPFRGYFDFINSVDLFVFHDDLQFTKQDWRNRNKIKTPNGLIWLTVPVKKHPTATLIDEVDIAGNEWIKEHKRLLTQHLGAAPYFRDMMDLWSVCEYEHFMLSQLNISLIRRINRYLGITTEIIRSRTLGLTGTKTDRLIDLMKKVGGTTYLSGPAAKAYLNVTQMNDNGIQVEWKEYNYQPYPQLHGPFEYFVSVLDLIANCGPDAKNHIKSYTDDEMRAWCPHWNQ